MLLAARQVRCHLRAQILEFRKIAKHNLEIGGDRCRVTAIEGTHFEVLVHGQKRENLPALGNVCDALAGHPVGVAALNFAAVQQHLAFAAVKRTAGRLQKRALACAICAEDGDNLSLVDRQADAANRHDRTIKGLEVFYLQQGNRHAAPPR